MNKIEEFYDNQYEEWDRFYKHPVEFEMTKRYIDSYIPNNSLDIIDIGGGPGRYSFYLASKGHRVTLLDLSKHNIDTAKEKSKELGIDVYKRQVFMEPDIVSKFTSELSVLQAEESMEVYKILAILTEMIYERIKDLKMNVEVISEYDLSLIHIFLTKSY